MSHLATPWTMRAQSFHHLITSVTSYTTERMVKLWQIMLCFFRTSCISICAYHRGPYSTIQKNKTTHTEGVGANAMMLYVCVIA